MSFNSRFYHFLGIIIASDKTEETLTKAFVLLKSILPHDSSYNSSSGTSVIMTDNCDEPHQSFSYNWPDAALLQCTSKSMEMAEKLVCAKDIKDYVSAYVSQVSLNQTKQTSMIFMSNLLKIYVASVNAGQDVFEMMN